MVEKPQSSIRLAIRACIIRCTKSDSPLTCLEDFIDGLRQSDWSAASLHQIERGTLLALAELDDSSCLAGR